MALSITRGKSKYAYQILPDDPYIVWVRKNVHNARWKVFGIFNTPKQATAALLRLEGGTDARSLATTDEVTT